MTHIPDSAEQLAFHYIKDRRKFFNISAIEEYCCITRTSLLNAINRGQQTFGQSDKLVDFLNEFFAGWEKEMPEFQKGGIVSNLDASFVEGGEFILPNRRPNYIYSKVISENGKVDFDAILKAIRKAIIYQSDIIHPKD